MKASEILSSKQLQIFLLALIVIIGTYFFLNKNSNVSTDFKPLQEPKIWEFRPTVNTDVEKNKIKEDISNLEKRLEGSDTATVFDLYLSLAQKYQLLGDGKAVFENLSKAHDTLPERALPFMNAGSVMVRLYATSSARAFFEEAVQKEPGFIFAHLALLDFYRVYDTETSFEKKETAFKEAIAHEENDTRPMREYAGWLEDLNKKEEAVSVWKDVLTKQPADKLEIETHIKELGTK
jgi:tetratricopeptide (TPR) repeat protein